MKETVWDSAQRWGRRHPWLSILALVGCIAAGLMFALRAGPPLSDADQIRAAMLEGERAVETKDLSGLMRLVSNTYSDDLGLNKDRLRLMTLNGFRGNKAIWITLDNLNIQPHGETAVATADVTVEAAPREGGETSRQTLPMTFHFTREAGHRYLVFPANTWRVTKAEGAGISIGSDLFGF